LTMTWYFPQLEAFVPGWLSYYIYPINKADFDILRFAHFLALAVVGLRFVPPNWAGLRSPLAQPLILFGQYWLQIFALGDALSFAGYALLMELDAGVALHFLVGAAGIVILYGVASTFSWYKRVTASAPRAKTPTPPASAPASAGP